MVGNQDSTESIDQSGTAFIRVMDDWREFRPADFEALASAFEWGSGGRKDRRILVSEVRTEPAEAPSNPPVVTDPQLEPEIRELAMEFAADIGNEIRYLGREE